MGRGMRRFSRPHPAVRLAKDVGHEVVCDKDATQGFYLVVLHGAIGGMRLKASEGV